MQSMEYDDSEKNRLEDALKESVKRYEELVSLIPVGVYILWIRANGRYEFEYVSDRWCAIHGLRREDVLTDVKVVNNLVHPDHRESFLECHRETFRDRKPFQWEGRYFTGDGMLLWLRIESTPVLFENGDIRCFGVTQDITERKQAEEKLVKSVDEKNMLMKELNHRVKNNLLLVNSLINLKDSSLGNIVDLSDLTHQIDAIRIVHEKLYQSEDISHVSANEYIHDLLSTIFSFHNKRITIQEKIEIKQLSTRIAVPIGLIVNEIATNAVKHGYVDENEARFTVELKEDKSTSRYLLRLSNSGKTFPKNIELDNPDTLGLQLITALVSQLDGTIELQREPHPVFTIRFPMKDSE